MHQQSGLYTFQKQCLALQRTAVERFRLCTTCLVGYVLFLISRRFRRFLPRRSPITSPKGDTCSSYLHSRQLCPLHTVLIHTIPTMAAR